MAHDVFISHSAKDKPTADALCATLEHEGLRCWIAPRDIVPGTNWGESIIDAISESRLMLLIFSSNANQSQQILREVERAVTKGIPIIPFRIEDVNPNKSLEYFISTPHWLDALTPPLEKHMEQLAVTVKFLLSKKDDSEITAPSSEERVSGEGETSERELDSGQDADRKETDPVASVRVQQESLKKQGFNKSYLAIGLIALLVICGAAYFLYSGFGQTVKPVMEVDTTLRDLYSGPLKIGAGKTELTVGKYIITSSEGLATNYPFSTVEVTDFRASSIIEVLDREDYLHYAGIVYVPSQSGFLDEGSIIFGKDGRKIFVSRIVNNTWERILTTDIMSNPRDPDKFEIVRQNGGYRFLLNGEEIVTYVSPDPQSGWPQFYVMEGSKAEFSDWSVYKFQKAVMSPPEYDTDRKGEGRDYRNFTLGKDDYELCLEECAREPRCKAWTYVKPGVQGSSARCWLKDGRTRSESLDCCISGTKKASYN